MNIFRQRPYLWPRLGIDLEADSQGVEFSLHCNPLFDLEIELYCARNWVARGFYFGLTLLGTLRIRISSPSR